MSETTQPRDLIPIPPQPSVEERLAKALDAVDRQFGGDFSLFAKSVLPGNEKSRPAKQVEEVLELVRRAS